MSKQKEMKFDPEIMKMYFRITGGNLPTSKSKWEHKLTIDHALDDECIMITRENEDGLLRNVIKVFDDHVTLENIHSINYVQMGGDPHKNFINLQKGMGFDEIYSE